MLLALYVHNTERIVVIYVIVIDHRNNVSIAVGQWKMASKSGFLEKLEQ